MMIDSTPSGHRPTVLYRCHPDVVWAVETGGLILIRRDTGKKLILGYPEAALWDFLSRGIPLQRVKRMMVAIAHIEQKATHKLVNETIGVWTQEGWLTGGGEDG